jgi:hypothetical protein
MISSIKPICDIIVAAIRRKSWGVKSAIPSLFSVTGFPSLSNNPDSVVIGEGDLHITNGGNHIFSDGRYWIVCKIVALHSATKNSSKMYLFICFLHQKTHYFIENIAKNSNKMQ